MSGGIRLTRLRDPYDGEVAEPRDLRTSAATRSDGCVLLRSGHHSHLNPMRKAAKDKEGRWGTVLAVRDSGVEVALDDGEVVRLLHHDTARQGDLWLAHPRLFWQGAWGWAWAGGRGVSVVPRGGWRRCSRGGVALPPYLAGSVVPGCEGAGPDGGGA